MASGERGHEQAKAAHAAVAAAGDHLALVSLRIGLLLLAIVTAADATLAVADDAGLPLITVGALIVLLALAGARLPRAAGKVLRPRGRMILLAILLATLGLALRGLHARYSDVEFGLACVAAIVCAPLWVLGFVVASALGIALDDVAAGHTLGWIATGPGQAELVNASSIMLAGAVVWVGVIWVLRHTVVNAPLALQQVRRGAARSLTPRLASAVRGEPAGLLMRGDATAIVEPLSAAERRVLTLLATGLAPKQAARRLDLAVATVRSHIATAKRKTGARTLEQLVGLFAEAEHDD